MRVLCVGSGCACGCSCWTGCVLTWLVGLRARVIVCLQDGRTALWTARLEGHVGVVDALLGCGANVDAVNEVRRWLCDVGVGLRFGLCE